MLLAALALPLRGCGRPAETAPAVTVYAAASTGPLLTRFARGYEARTGTKIRLNLAASSTLARQIEHGAAADLFLSAHPQWMDELASRGLIDPASRREVLGNRLVMVIPAEDSLGLVVNFKMDHHFDFAAAWPGRLAIGDPDHVPAGMYARQALTALGWWDGVADRVVTAMNVRAALRLVERREVQSGIVYASDAASSPEVAVVATFPPRSHEPIRYPMALRGGASAAAVAFAAALEGPEFRALAASYGFDLPPEPGRE